MSKVNLGARTILYPHPAVLVGANIDGKPNFSTYAWCGIANSRPPMLSIALQHQRYTLKGIKQTGTFSVNLPSVDIVKETDYCGMVSGSETDKVADCKFNIFYGKLGNAPLITECPVNLECNLVHLLNLGSHELVIGEIIEVYATDTCITDGKPDFDKIKPFLWGGFPDNRYYTFGQPIGKGFDIGKQLKTPPKPPQ